MPLGFEAGNGPTTLWVRAVCNLYSITTNQAAIAALFRVMNRYVGNLPPMPGVFPDYPAPGGTQYRCRTRVDRDALGNAAAAADGRRTSNEHTEYVLAALARLVEAGKPMLSLGH
jgi:hypothetical protein